MKKLKMLFVCLALISCSSFAFAMEKEKSNLNLIEQTTSNENEYEKKIKEKLLEEFKYILGDENDYCINEGFPRYEKKFILNKFLDKINDETFFNEFLKSKYNEVIPIIEYKFKNADTKEENNLLVSIKKTENFDAVLNIENDVAKLDLDKIKKRYLCLMLNTYKKQHYEEEFTNLANKVEDLLASENKYEFFRGLSKKRREEIFEKFCIEISSRPFSSRFLDSKDSIVPILVYKFKNSKTQKDDNVFIAFKKCENNGVKLHLMRDMEISNKTSPYVVEETREEESMLIK